MKVKSKSLSRVSRLNIGIIKTGKARFLLDTNRNIRGCRKLLIKFMSHKDDLNLNITIKFTKLFDH